MIQTNMQLEHVNAKIFLDGELTVDPERFIETFHHWIQQAAVEGLLLDVADYRHVPNAPAVLLIGHDGDYGIDQTGGRWGMLYNRKTALDGSNDDRLRQALAAAAKACQLIEQEFGDSDSLKFSRQEFQFVVNDRALVSNTPETFDACRGEIEAFLQGLLGHADFALSRDEEPRRRFNVTVRSEKPFDLSTLC